MGNPEDLKYLNAINRVNGIGPQRLRKLLAFFDSPKDIWKAGLEDLAGSGIGETLAQKFFEEKNIIDPDEEWEKLEKENIDIITLDDTDYPKLLREIPNPPFLLYIRSGLSADRGAPDSWKFDSSPLVAIVGSRKYTDYGARVAEKLAFELAQSGITVVSGMALGIDSVAHSGALEGGGKTIAILGNGLDNASLYPRDNFNLSREIMENGALLSDYPVGTKSGKITFPARNRLIAGLTLGTVVIEAGEKSGSLITAGLALEYDREVFAVPGPIFSDQSLGTNDLIKKGAKTVTSVKDILEEIGFKETLATETKIERIPENKDEEILLKILSPDPLHIDNIARLAKLETMRVSSALSMMEIKGWIRNIGGQNYVLN